MIQTLAKMMSGKETQYLPKPNRQVGGEMKEYEIRQIICGNKELGGWTPQQYDQAHTIYEKLIEEGGIMDKPKRRTMIQITEKNLRDILSLGGSLTQDDVDTIVAVIKLTSQKEDAISTHFIGGVTPNKGRKP